MNPFKFTKRSKWAEISTKFCRYQGLPFGSRLDIVYTKNPAYPKGRVQRNNTYYRRTAFRQKSMPRASASDTVRHLIDFHLLPYIDIDLKAMGAEIFAYLPDGLKIENWGTKVGTWRKATPQLTADEIESENERQQEIAEIEKEAQTMINNMAEFRWNPEETIPQGFLRALVRIYGPHVIRSAIDEELG